MNPQISNDNIKKIEETKFAEIKSLKFGPYGEYKQKGSSNEKAGERSNRVLENQVGQSGMNSRVSCLRCRQQEPYTEPRKTRSWGWWPERRPDQPVIVTVTMIKGS